MLTIRKEYCMKDLVETKAMIIKGTSKSGNTFYGLKVWITPTYATFILLKNGDSELVREKYDKENLNITDNNV